jgi:hypothetical protein
MKTPRLFVHCIATALAMIATAATPFVLGTNIASAHSAQHASKHATHWWPSPQIINLVEDTSTVTTTSDGTERYGDKLYTSSDLTTAVGTDDGICTPTSTAATETRYTCTFTITSADGSRSITASGLYTAGSTNIDAITGGTGSYTGAEGFVAFTPGSDSTHDNVTIVITGR